MFLPVFLFDSAHAAREESARTLRCNLNVICRKHIHYKDLIMMDIIIFACARA